MKTLNRLVSSMTGGLSLESPQGVCGGLGATGNRKAGNLLLRGRLGPTISFSLEAVAEKSLDQSGPSTSHNRHCRSFATSVAEISDRNRQNNHRSKYTMPLSLVDGMK